MTFLYQFLRGASTRSHGVHVARLAGLPEKLLLEASQQSARLEAELEDKYTLQLARRLLAIGSTSDTDLEPLWQEAAAWLR